jgi:hypothetical protein
MNDIRKILDYTGRFLFFGLAIVTIGCAENTGVRDSAGTSQSPQTEQMSSSQTDANKSAAAEDARFMTVEEQGAKTWKASGPGRVDSASNTLTINAKDRGTQPLRLKVVNNLNAEHGFAIDTMKVKEVLKPGEERIISVLLENVEPSTTRHRVYCQLHEKHGPATLIINKGDSSTAGTIDSGTPGRNLSDSSRPAQSRQDERPSDSSRPSQSRQDAGSVGSGTQSGEVSSSVSGESEGQRTIREQSLRQREIESTSRAEKAPSSIDPQACEGFPGFDRGCPGASK